MWKNVHTDCGAGILTHDLHVPYHSTSRKSFVNIVPLSNAVWAFEYFEAK